MPRKYATRLQYIAELRRDAGNNTAILRHIAKLEQMNEDQYIAHRTELDRRLNSNAAKSTITRLTSDLSKKIEEQNRARDSKKSVE